MACLADDEIVDGGWLNRCKLLTRDIGYAMSASRIAHVDQKDTDLYQLLKAAWPAKAVPGDEGYGGAGVSINRSLLTEREKAIYDHGIKNLHANLLASERIPVRRHIALDIPECRNLTYDTTLPTAGIVLVVYEEMWSSLLRTIFSILDAGPVNLITEIILVDDGSQKEHLGKALQDYIKIFGGKVKLIRLPERKGLIVARNVGAQHVTGDVVVLLDAHCEVDKGWLEPLLNRIKQDDSVMVIPYIHAILWDTFEFQFTKSKTIYRAGFEFDMEFRWIPAPPLDGITRKSLTDPVPSPTHLGCCLAITKINFERLGWYDPGLEIWGCENLELSFKTWMCGGRIELIPCSNIAHLYRPDFPYSRGNKSNVYQRNCLRVAEVWMDQYKVFYQDRADNSKIGIDFGDVSERKALREKRSSVDPLTGTLKRFIPISTYQSTQQQLACHQHCGIGIIAGCSHYELQLLFKECLIYNVHHPGVCIERNLRVNEAETPIAAICTPTCDRQYFYLTKEKQIRRDTHCLSYNEQKQHFVSNDCKYNPGTWTYSMDNLIRFDGTDLCIALLNKSTIGMAKCNSTDTSQQWSWSRKSIAFSL